MSLFRTLLFFLVLWISYIGYLNGNQIPKFIPQGYHLDIFPGVNTRLLKGLVSINIATYAEPSNIIELDADPTIIIHYKSIKVSEISGSMKNDTNIRKVLYEVTAVERVLFDRGTLKIHLSQNLQRDITYQVHLSFETMLKNDINQPFYMRTFFDHDTRSERKFIVMDLTKNGCYKAFPCFNEPDYKCWVSLTVIRKPNFYALSTASVNYTINVGHDGSLVKDFFLKTPPMSMNSLALVISDYRLITALHSPEVIDFNTGIQIDRPREIGPIVKIIMKRVEERLGIPFPLPAFHVIMVPELASMPYINAFGLLVMNISNFNDDYSLIQDLTFGACYQWFIHMASPSSQNSRAAYITITHLKNIIAEEIAENVEINSLNKFDYGQLIFMNLLLTQTENLQSVDNFTSQIFEQLSFSMLDRIFPNLFTEAMHKLLRRKEFKIYTETDFWSSLNDVINKQESGHKEYNKIRNLREIVDSWKENKVVPMVTVTRDYKSDLINVTQESFIYAKDKYKVLRLRKIFPRYKLPILPIVISQPSNFISNNQLIGWMKPGSSSYTFELASQINPLDLIVVNPGHLGAFLVNYDKKNWHMLTDNFRFLPSDIQLQLLVDSLILSNVGLLDYSIFLNMSAKMIIDEQHLPLWIKYSTLVSDVMERFDGTLAEKYKEFLSKQKEILFSRISTKKLEKYSAHVRNKINEMKYRLDCLTYRASCFTPFEYENLIHESRAGKRLSGKHNCEVIRNVSLFDWQIIANGLFHILPNSSTSDRFYILYILSCTEQTSTFETYMNLLLLNFNKSSLLLNEEDQKYVLAHMDYYHLRALKYFTDKNFEALKQRLSHDSWMALMDSIIKSTRSQEDLDELLEFSNKHARQFDDATKEFIKDGIEMVTMEVKWKAETFPILEELMDNILETFSNADIRFRKQPNGNYYFG